jgi:ribonuclease BN (tRNA processing enzyme)
VAVQSREFDRVPRHPNLTSYLHTVFDNRPDLHNTLDLISITHNHIDHTRALRAVVEQFSVLRYIDNGQLTGTGTANPNWIRATAQTGGRNIVVREIANTDITSLPDKTD